MAGWCWTTTASFYTTFFPVTENDLGRNKFRTIKIGSGSFYRGGIEDHDFVNKWIKTQRSFYPSNQICEIKPIRRGRQLKLYTWVWKTAQPLQQPKATSTPSTD
jgi:hypothetical protein